jgi:uncharacterized protein (TIGR00251 family)
MPFVLQAENGELLLLVHIQPKASKTRIVGLHDGRLKVAVASPPVDGKANKEIIAFLARVFGIKKHALRLKSGAQSRRKVIAIDSFAIDEARSVLSEYVGGEDA